MSCFKPMERVRKTRGIKDSNMRKQRTMKLSALTQLYLHNYCILYILYIYYKIAIYVKAQLMPHRYLPPDILVSIILTGAGL